MLFEPDSIFSAVCVGVDCAGKVVADVTFGGDGDCSVLIEVTGCLDSTVRTAVAADFGTTGVGGAAEA